MRRRTFLGLLALGCGDEMASYPSSPNKYPVTPKSFPASPNAYPAAGASAGPTDPLTIITSVPWAVYLVGDLGITLGTGVSAWADQSGNGNDATQATGIMQPAFNASGLNGRGTLGFDGSNDHLVFSSLDLPAPGTTPIWIWTVFRQDAWISGDSLYGAGASVVRCRKMGVTPQLRPSNASDGPLNAGAVVASWCRLENLFTNSTSDYLKLASTTATGSNCGNNDPASGAFVLGSHVTGSSFADSTHAAFGICLGNPSGAEKTALDAWVAAYYGAGVLL